MAANQPHINVVEGSWFVKSGDPVTISGNNFRIGDKAKLFDVGSNDWKTYANLMHVWEENKRAMFIAPEYNGNCIGQLEAVGQLPVKLAIETADGSICSNVVTLVYTTN